MKVVDIANEIFLENASPSDTSISAIAFWIRSNVGKLNAMLYEDFSVDDEVEIVDTEGNEIPILAASILKTMYKVYRTELDIRAMLGSITNDTIQVATDEGFSIKKVDRAGVLRSLATLKKDTIEELYSLVHNYRSIKGPPSQVAGDDTIEGIYPHNFNAYERRY